MNIPIPVDLDGARAALADYTGRTADLIAGIDDLSRPTSGLDWTLGETATHLLVACRLFTAALEGDLSHWLHFIPDVRVYRDRMAAVTAGTIAVEPRRDAQTLSRLLRHVGDVFLATSAGRSAQEMVPAPWLGEGASLALGAATCLVLGELVVHGHDMARTLRRPWPIEREHALLVLPAPLAMMPMVLDPAVVRGLEAVYAFHIRGGVDASLSIRDGRASVEPIGRATGRIDCHIAADATAFMMVAYGRLRLRSAILRGSLMAYGRKPWLGLGIRNLFFLP